MRHSSCLAVPLAISFYVSFFTARLQADDHVKPDQLVGAWVRTTPADITGMEFTKDGKVMLYFGVSNESQNADFSIQADGRLNLSLGGQLNNFFLPTLANDQLQLKDPDSAKVASYRRVKNGETMAAAIAGADKAEKQSVQNHDAAVPTFLSRPDLVMVIDHPVQGSPGNCALQWSQTSGTEFTGRAYFDSKPPHMEQASAQIQPADADNTLKVAVWFGPGTAQQNGAQGTWYFHPASTGAEMTLTSQVNFGDQFSTGPNTAVVIKSDPALFKRITGTIKEEATRLEGLKAPVVAMLKDYVVIKGMSQSQNANDHGGLTEQFILSRSGNGYVGQGQSTNRTTGVTELFPVMANVGIMKDKPAIQIASQKRVYLFSDIDPSGSKLTGQWALPQSQSGHPAEFAIVQAFDSKARDELFTKQKASLQKLNGQVVYNGVVADQFNTQSQPPNPISVTLTVDEKGAATGKVDYAMEGCTMELQGKVADTPLGPQLVLQYKAGQADTDACNDAKNFMDALQHEIWTLQATEDASGAMLLTGYAIVKPAANAPPLTLRLYPFGDKDKTDLTKSITDGARFKVTTPQMGNDPETVLTFTTAADGKVTAQITSGGTHINARLNQKFTGDIKDKDGFTELDMLFDNNGRKPNYGCVMLISPSDTGIYLTAATYSTNAGGPKRPLGHWDAMQVK